MVNGIFAGDTFPVGCAFDKANIHDKVINYVSSKKPIYDVSFLFLNYQWT